MARSPWTRASLAEQVPGTTALRAVPTAPGWHISTARDGTARLWATGPPASAVSAASAASADDAPPPGLVLHHTFDIGGGGASGLVVHTSAFPRSTKLALVLHDKIELWDFFHNRNPIAAGVLLSSGGCG